MHSINAKAFNIITQKVPEIDNYVYLLKLS